MNLAPWTARMGHNCQSLLFVLLCGIAQAADIHVSPTGSDEKRGSREAPVQTLEMARVLAQSLRKSKSKEPVNILLHPGTHTIRKTVAFQPEDSGTAEAPLSILAWHDPAAGEAKPLLVGGAVVTGWKKSTFNGRSDVFEADLKPLRLAAPFRQVYLNGRRLTWARYPNEDEARPYSGGWAYVDGVRPPMYKDIEGERTDTVLLRAKDARRWSRPQDGEVCIFPRYNWWNRIERIAAYDPQTRTITLANKMAYAARPEDRFCVMGMREELDAPGEWFEDVENQKLYLILPAGADLAKDVVTVPTVNDIVSFNGTHHVRIRGLELSGAEQCALRFADCEDALVERCSIHDLGYFQGAAISLDRGTHGTVRGCDIWNIGGHGVSVSGGDLAKLQRCDHLADNCYIHHVGQFNRHGIGVMLGGVGIRVAHNLIHDVPRCGIFHGGALNTLEFNRIRHCNLEMEDSGCTYTGGWCSGWQTIRYNHCSDSIGFDNHGRFFVFAWGIYLDESGCGNDVYGNIVERCQVGAMHLHNARENHIENNIFISNAGPAGKTHQLSLQTWDNSPNGVFLSDRQPKMLEEYQKLMTNPAWAAMRGMQVSPANPFLPDGTIMRGNRITRNIFYYPHQPDSRYISENGVNLHDNTIDSNTVWNGGKVPVKTGKQAFKKSIADLTERIPNADFSRRLTPEAVASAADHTVAADWRWYHKTFPNLQAEIVAAGKKHALRLPGAFNKEMKYIQNTCVRSTPFALAPGRHYRLTFRLRHKDATGELVARLVCESQGLWKAFGSRGFQQRSDRSDVATASEQIECQTAFGLPKPGDADYDARVTELSLHFQFNSSQGWAEISDLRLEEVEPATEWEAWQMAGADTHSVVADPLFVDVEHGDFALKPDSPAVKLGFKPIPFREIGPYCSDARASWPIREAEGARENPQWLESMPAGKP
jgi:parallel beta-helix repeat protein